MYISRNIITIRCNGVIQFLMYLIQFLVSVWYPVSARTTLGPMFLHKQIPLIVLN